MPIVTCLQATVGVRAQSIDIDGVCCEGRQFVEFVGVGSTRGTAFVEPVAGAVSEHVVLQCVKNPRDGSRRDDPAVKTLLP